MPPVMVRGAVPGTAKIKRKRSKTRRRYDVALGVPGAEMRLPSIPQVRPGWRLVSFVMVALLSVLIYHLWTSPVYRVQAAEVGGLNRVTNDEVNAALNIEDEPIFTLDANQMQERLSSAFPEFSAVSVQVALPATVAVTVTERIPVLIWHQGSKTELVDAEGVAFSSRGEAADARLPVVEAKSAPPSPIPQAPKPAGIELKDIQPLDDQPVSQGPNYFMTPDLVKAVLVLSKQAPKNTAMVYDAQHGLGWKDARGWEVYFGDAQDITMKLRVYKAIINQLMADDTQPALVSVEYVHAPYYRLEK
jgi:cell division protein FtsQ